MIKNIREISNPILRAITAGIFLGSLVTVPAALAVQLVKSPKDSNVESTSKLAVYASLASTAIGAAIGLGAGKRRMSAIDYLTVCWCERMMQLRSNPQIMDGLIGENSSSCEK
jgi:hypothetical protein